MTLPKGKKIKETYVPFKKTKTLVFRIDEENQDMYQKWVRMHRAEGVPLEYSCARTQSHTHTYTQTLWTNEFYATNLLVA